MPDAQLSLKLIYRANIFVVDRTHPALQMGRDDSNGIVVLSLFASRVHARVEARGAQFILVDLSSNGTFVLADENQADAESDVQPEEIRLRQEEMVLSGRGWFGMGRSATKHGDHSVRYMLQAETS